MLNSAYYRGSGEVANYAEEQERWLDGQLEEAKGKQIICFSHIPWFVRHVNEARSLSNIPTKIRKHQLDKLYNAGGFSYSPKYS